MGPAQWGPAFVGLWATRRRSKDVPAAFCCDKDSDSSPLGARTFNFPPSPTNSPTNGPDSLDWLGPSRGGGNFRSFQAIFRY